MVSESAPLLKYAAVLDTMVGEGEHAPGWFCINPKNHSGRRLYRLFGLNAKGGDPVWVTNICPQVVDSPKKLGTPDPIWLARNLNRVRIGVLLVCGNRAHSTFDSLGYKGNCPVFYLPHPAARNWTKKSIEKWQARIRKVSDGDD